MKVLFRFLIPCLFLTFVGCAGLQPIKTVRVEGGWQDFDEVEQAVKDELVLGKTTFNDLKNGKFNPRKRPRTTFLSNPDIRSIFKSTEGSSGNSLQDLPPAVQDCLAEKDGAQCHGVKFEQDDQDRRGEGNIGKRIIGLEKKDRITGWWYRLVLVFKDVILVDYRLSGEPNRNYVENEKSPTKPIEAAIGLGLRSIPGF